MQINKKKGNEKVKKDVACLMHSSSSMEASKAAVCFLTLNSVILKGLDARRHRALRHIMLELSYGHDKW